MRNFEPVLFALALLTAMPGVDVARGETVRIALPKTLIFFPVYAAESLGLFAEEGVQAELMELPGPSASLAMVESRVDLSATFAERPIAFLREGKSIKNVVTLLAQNPVVLVVRSDIAAREVSALKGLRVGSTVPRSGSDLTLRAILRGGGLDLEKDVTIEFAGVNGLISALRERKIDAGIMATDFAAQLIHERVVRSLVDPRQGEGPALVREMNFTTLQASATMLETRPDAVAKVVRAVVRAQQRLRDDGTLAARTALQLFPSVDAAVMQAIVDADRPTYRPEITEEMMRGVHAGLRGSVLPADDPPVPFADVVAVRYRPLWSR